MAKVVNIMGAATPPPTPPAPPPAGPPNWNDPCERAQLLWDAYNRLVAGAQETSVTYQANGVTRRVIYATASLAALLNALREAQYECAIQEGKTPPRRRFAIVAGSRRYRW
jgi:hypothetical protein